MINFQSMKRLVLSFLCVITFSVIYAQNNIKEHLLFVDVPIDGSIASFSHNLTKSGDFERRPEKDEKGLLAFSGDIFEEGIPFWVWAYYDTKREINDNLVFQVVISRWFDSKEEATSYLTTSAICIEGLYQEHITNTKRTETSLDVDMDNGSFEAILKAKGEGKWSMVARFLDYANDRRVFKTLDYYDIPARGKDGTYDISPEKLIYHDR